MPKNHLYQSKGPAGRSASLRPSGERVRDFYAADLLSGEVEKGDDVIFYLNPISKKNAEKEPNHSHHEDLDTKKTHPS